jgi:CRP-like cAMP-binding protein
MALVDTAPRSARAVAGSDCQLIPVDPKWFCFMVEQTPYFARHVMKIMADRLRRVIYRRRIVHQRDRCDESRRRRELRKGVAGAPERLRRLSGTQFPAVPDDNGLHTP